MKFLFYLFLFYIIARLFFRYALPFLLGMFLKNEIRKQQRNFDQGKEGDIHIYKKGGRKKKGDQQQGDYIDFEDVD